MIVSLLHGCFVLGLATPQGAVVAASSTDAAAALARGREAMVAGRFDEARAAFEQSVSARPDDSRGWSLLARSRCSDAEQWAAKGDEEATRAEELATQAEEAARRAIDLDEGDGEAWATLGHVLVRVSKVEEAIATLYHVEKLGKPTPEAMNDLVDALLMARQIAADNQDESGAQSRLAEAEAALERATDRFDSQLDLLRRRASLYAAKGDDEIALRHYRKAIQLAPAGSELLTSLLEEHLRLVEKTQGFDTAIDFCTGLVDTPALGRWYRSRLYELKGNHALNKKHDYAAAAEAYENAERDFKQAGKLDPNLAEAVAKYLPNLRAYRGKALTLAEKYPEAEGALFAALDLDSKNTLALTLLHELQDAMWKKYGGESMPKDKLDEIRAFASKLATTEPENAENWNNWGLFARDAGKYEESYLAYRRALAIDPENPNYLNDTAVILLYHLGRDLDRAEVWLRDAIRFAERGLKQESRSTTKKKDDETALGDAYGNLMNICDQSNRRDDAIAALRELEKKLPARSEVSYWKKKLLPDEWQADQDAKKAAADAKKANEVPAAAPDAKKPEGGNQ